jgi:outer membrane receptor protein involved in Fe transport
MKHEDRAMNETTQAIARRQPLAQAPRLFAVVALLVIAAPVAAQVTTADVVGVVMDSSGGRLPGVTIAARNVATGQQQTAATDSQGNFQILRLAPGRYQISAALDGFRTIVNDVELAIGDRYRFDPRMEIGVISEQILVTGESPVLQTERASVAVLVDARAMQDLPLNGRNFVRLAQIAPGANEGPPNSLSSGNRPDDRRASSSVSINGQDTSLNNFLIDGLDNNERFIGTVIVRPSVDAIQEMRVETNAFSAELGRAAGGVINVVTKSGTNQLHGSIFEFYRNEALDSGNFFAASGPKPEYKQHQFGGSLGGRIIADKSFFFADYAGLRLRQGNTYTSTIPTLSMRRGDFSGLAPIFDPQTGAQFPNNQIPANRTDPAAIALTRLYPAPTNSALANNFVYSPTKTQDDDSFDVRIDHRFDPNNLLFARYSYNNTTTVLPDSLPPVDGITPGGLGNTIFPGSSRQKPQAAQVNFDHVFSPGLVLEAKSGFSRYDAATVTPNYGLNASQQVGIPGINIPGDLDSSGLSQITIAGFPQFGDAGFIPLIIANDLWQGLSTLTFFRGAHTLKVGVDVKHRAVVAQQSTSARGLFAFNANFTSNAGAAGTGHPFASFLLGYPASTSRNKYLVKPTYLSAEMSSFAQYDWRARPWLTLNLGLRYDYFSQLSETNNQISNVDLAAARIIVAGSDTSSTAGLAEDVNNFSPRVGVAVTIDPKTVVRGGYGISYTPPVQGTGGALRNPPFVSLLDITPSAFVPINRLSDGLPAPLSTSTTAPTGALAPIDFNIVMPWVHQFNVAVQRELPGRTAATVGYVGVLGRDVVVTVPVNTPPPGPGPVQPRRPLVNVFPLVAGIGYRTNAQTSNYRATYLVLEKRFSAGWGGRIGYTWAHQRVTAPDSQYPFTSIPAGANPFPAMLNSIRYETADAGQDIRHRLTVGVNYELGVARSATGLTGFLAKGWQVNAIALFQSGTPFNITNGSARSNTGSGDRPNQSKDPNLPSSQRTLTRWFDTSAFEPQPLFTLGNTPLNAMHGPGVATLDLSVFKDFVPRNGTRIQFRIEAFNITDRVNYGNPGSALGTSSFGVISSAGPARNVQLAVKFLF